MAKRYNILPLIGAAGGTAVNTGTGSIIGRLQVGNYTRAAETGISKWTGFDAATGKFEIKHATGLGGLALGAIGSKLAAKTGLNRYLPKGINL